MPMILKLILSTLHLLILGLVTFLLLQGYIIQKRLAQPQVGGATKDGEGGEFFTYVNLRYTGIHSVMH